MEQRFGGSFAPPLGVEVAEGYGTLMADAPPQAADAMRVLLNLVKEHQSLRPTAVKGTPHRSGQGAVRPLSAETLGHLDPHVPWNEELVMFGEVFGKIEPGPLRNAAFHLLWYATELSLGREPVTTDKL